MYVLYFVIIFICLGFMNFTCINFSYFNTCIITFKKHACILNKIICINVTDENEKYAI